MYSQTLMYVFLIIFKFHIQVILYISHTSNSIHFTYKLFYTLDIRVIFKNYLDFVCVRFILYHNENMYPSVTITSSLTEVFRYVLRN